MKFISIALLVLTYHTIDAKVANDGYVYFYNVLKSYKLHSEPQTWYNSRTVCQQEGATLALPNNALEAKVIVDFFNENLPAKLIKNVTFKDDLLLGFHDLFVDGEFLSLEGKPLQNYFHEWGKGEPNSKAWENCGSMKRSGLLNDYPCWVPAVFICEKKNNVETAYRCNGKICYKLHLNAKTWHEARHVCLSEDGRLAVVRDKNAEKFLVRIFEEYANHITVPNWNNQALIGIHQFFGKGNFVTVEDKSINSYEYVNWLNGPPDSIVAENCISMHKQGAITFHSCTSPNVFICEKPLKENENFGVDFSKMFIYIEV